MNLVKEMLVCAHLSIPIKWYNKQQSIIILTFLEGKETNFS